MQPERRTEADRQVLGQNRKRGFAVDELGVAGGKGMGGWGGSVRRDGAVEAGMQVRDGET